MSGSLPLWYRWRWKPAKTPRTCTGQPKSRKASNSAWPHFRFSRGGSFSPSNSSTPCSTYCAKHEVHKRPLFIGELRGHRNPRRFGANLVRKRFGSKRHRGQHVEQIAVHAVNTFCSSAKASRPKPLSASPASSLFRVCGSLQDPRNPSSSTKNSGSAPNTLSKCCAADIGCPSVLQNVVAVMCWKQCSLPSPSLTLAGGGWL